VEAIVGRCDRFYWPEEMISRCLCADPTLCNADSVGACVR
jgi:hypothetical protein